MCKPLITDIQKYSIHNGAGIRTTVFFKGCPLSCIWCHNPETQSFSEQLLFDRGKCTGCGSCVPACPSKAIRLTGKLAATEESKCAHCGVCLDYCLQNIREIAGKHYTIKALMEEIEKDKVFYEQSGGGVTFSGGEVFAQDMDYMEELLSKLHGKGYRIDLDTSGYAPFHQIKRLLPYVDTFLYDVKIMDTDLHKRYTGVDNHLILENLKKLSEEQAAIWIRIPVIGGVNNTTAHMEAIAKFIKAEKISIRQIHLLPYHNTGSGKYKRLNREYKGEDYYPPTNDELNNYVTVFQQYGFNRIITGG
ncbi:glycyl-radical enzyme activating protein [Lacrimispora sp.]|uniref:glycyl-radical enzyme activating protein n=1 Tax=Lacrimispora sp. TaxID=2719234 RepID=UPI003992DD73